MKPAPTALFATGAAVAFAAGLITARAVFWGGASAAPPPRPAALAGDPDGRPPAGRGRGERPGRATGSPVDRLDELLQLNDSDRALGAFQSLLAIAGRRDFPALFERLNRQIDSPLKQTYIQLLIEAWPRVDPEGATAFFRRRGDYPSLNQTREVYRAWSQADPVAALEAAFAERLPHHGHALQAVIGEIARYDPEVARAALDRLAPADPLLPDLRGAVFKAWASLDPNAAAEAAGRLHSYRARREVFSEVARAWATYDGAAAAGWVESLPGGELQRSARGALLNSWLRSGAAAAADYLLRLPASPGTDAHFEEVAQALHRGDGLSAALRWVERIGDRPAAQKALVALTQTAAKEDPAAAAGLIGRIDSSDDRLDLTEIVAASWGRSSPAEAMAWAGSLQAGPASRARRGALRGWAASDPRGAAVHLMDLNPEERRHSARAVAHEWARTAPGEAVRWADAISGDEPAREAFMSAAFPRWVEVEPVGVRAFLLGMAPDDFRDRLAQVFLNRTYRADPAAAADLAATLLEGDALGRAAQEIGPPFAKAEPVAAARWIDRLPPGEGRDRSARSLAERVAPDEPASAFAWAESIRPGQLRAETVMTVLRLWAGRDPEAALAALAASPVLSDDERRAGRAAIGEAASSAPGNGAGPQDR